MSTTPPPIIWSIAGHDTAGGAGLSADQRAADAMGVHLCLVVAALTAQHSQGVDAIYPVPAEQLEAQLQALAGDMPPRAIKTGLLGSVQAIEVVARWVDRWRASCPEGVDPHQHLALVVDPVLRASSGGAAFSNDAIVAAYREHLLPRATLITPNHAEARRLLNVRSNAQADTPAWAQAMQALGARGVVITGGDGQGANSPHDSTHSADWLQTPQASGWLVAPRVDTPHHHGTGCTLATGAAAALALGHPQADACVLGKMLTHHALMHSRQAGQGRGPVVAQAGFACGPAQGGAPLPWLGLGEQWPRMLQSEAQHGARTPAFAPFTPPSNGLYGIVDRADMMTAAYAAGMRCMQLRQKHPLRLAEDLQTCAQAAARHQGQLFINDHWPSALALLDTLPAGLRLGIHLGQEDLLALSAPQQAQLLAQRSQVMLGLSSHSLWELCRAVGWGPSYIACGPLLPTTTKDMPWRPQGIVNLRWWVAHSPVPVVGIGGLLTSQQLQAHAAAGASALCVVRALGQQAHEVASQVALLEASLKAAPVRDTHHEIPLPHPVLD